MANRANTRANIRRIINQHPSYDQLAAAISTATATEITIGIPDLYSVGDIIGIGSELLRVVGKPEDSTKLTVSRGIAGTTAATHSNSATITLYPEFTDNDLNQAINYAVNKTYVDPASRTHGIWIYVSDTTLTTSAAREYTIPSGITFVSMVEIANASGNYMLNRRWRLSGTKIVFHDDLKTGYTIRVTGMGYQGQLSNDSTAWTLSDESLEFIEFTAAWHLLEWRLPERLRATIYSASVNERAGQPNDILNTIAYFRRRAEEILFRESKPALSTYLLAPKR